LCGNDERLGEPAIPNVVPPSKIHPAAFEAHLADIDPDYCPACTDRLLR
jgi:hypothetical protein